MKANLNNISRAINILEAHDYTPGVTCDIYGACNMMNLIRKDYTFNHESVGEWFGLQLVYVVDKILGINGDDLSRLEFSFFYGKFTQDITKEELLAALKELLLRVATVRIQVIKENLSDTEEAAMILESVRDMLEGKFPIGSNVANGGEAERLEDMGFNKDTVFKVALRSLSRYEIEDYNTICVHKVSSYGEICFVTIHPDNGNTYEGVDPHMVWVNVRDRYWTYVGQDNAMRPSKYIIENALEILEDMGHGITSEEVPEVHETPESHEAPLVVDKILPKFRFPRITLKKDRLWFHTKVIFCFSLQIAMLGWLIYMYSIGSTMIIPFAVLFIFIFMEISNKLDNLL